MTKQELIQEAVEERQADLEKDFKFKVRSLIAVIAEQQGYIKESKARIEDYKDQLKNLEGPEEISVKSLGIS